MLPNFVICGRGGRTRFKHLLLINILTNHMPNISMSLIKQAASKSYAKFLPLELPIIRVGLAFNYTIPSFPGISVTLRHVMYQFPCKDGSCKVFHGFMKLCPLLEVNLLALAAIEDDEAKAWYINVCK